jgi:hypothetical protein
MPTDQITDNMHIFGIRHHGPGSARSLRRALEELQPDAILVEGPPDAEDVLPLLTHAEMQPPVALLVYEPGRPERAVYYPFAVFSPEWQALRYGLAQNITVRFMDLPTAHRFAYSQPGQVEPTSEVNETQGTPAGDQAKESEAEDTTQAKIVPDPLGWLAEAAGYSDGERWWDHMIEHRRDGTDLFAAVLEAMTALREEAGPQTLADPLNDRREAYMRQTIRTAWQQGFRRIAVVCGAWHAPALAKMTPAKEDAELLKDLPKTSVKATWIPWTYGRLSYASGYGAGIESPGWYHHLWTVSDRVPARWLARVAALLRGEDLDCLN